MSDPTPIRPALRVLTNPVRSRAEEGTADGVLERSKGLFAHVIVIGLTADQGLEVRSSTTNAAAVGAIVRGALGRVDDVTRRVALQDLFPPRLPSAPPKDAE